MNPLLLSRVVMLVSMVLLLFLDQTGGLLNWMGGVTLYILCLSCFSYGYMARKGAK